MTRAFRFLVTILLSCLAAPAGAQDLAYRGFGAALSSVALNDGSQFGVDGFGTGDLRFGQHLGLQTTIGLQALGTDDDNRGAAKLALHPYARLGERLAVGVYAETWASSDPAFSTGLELAWNTPSGMFAEAWFGHTWGDELKDGGDATNKGAIVGYTFAHDLRGALFFNKDTTNESGRTDRDYYDYGLEVDAPIGSGDTHLIASLGQIRFDAEGGPETKLTLGVTRQFGGTAERPTLSRQRSVLTGLLGF